MNDEYISKKQAVDLLRSLPNPYNLLQLHTIGMAIYSIENEPAADVQPVKRGRWSECYTDSHHYSGICSVCGRASIKSLTESLYEYCPKCGARMDGDSE